MRHDTFADETETLYQRQAVAAAAQYARLVLRGHDALSAAESFASAYPKSVFAGPLRQAAVRLTRGVVDPLTTGSGAALLPAELTAPLDALGAPAAILGRLGAQRVPPHQTVPVLVGDPPAHWIGETPKPVSAGAFGAARVVPGTLSCLVVLSEELVRATGGDADAFLGGVIARVLAAATDVRLVADLATAGASSPPTTSGGSLATDLALALAGYRGSVARAVVLLSSANAVAAHLADPALCRELTATGGRVAGLPALCSDSVGNALVIADPTRVLVSLGDEVAIDRGRHATIEMESMPDGRGELRSMFQSNSVALRLERVVGWSFVDGAASAVGDVDYVTGGSPA